MDAFLVFSPFHTVMDSLDDANHQALIHTHSHVCGSAFEGSLGFGMLPDDHMYTVVQQLSFGGHMQHLWKLLNPTHHHLASTYLDHIKQISFSLCEEKQAERVKL